MQLDNNILSIVYIIIHFQRTKKGHLNFEAIEIHKESSSRLEKIIDWNNHLLTDLWTYKRERKGDLLFEKRLLIQWVKKEKEKREREKKQRIDSSSKWRGKTLFTNCRSAVIMYKLSKCDTYACVDWTLYWYYITIIIKSKRKRKRRIRKVNQHTRRSSIRAKDTLYD